MSPTDFTAQILYFPTIQQRKNIYIYIYRLRNSVMGSNMPRASFYHKATNTMMENNYRS